MAISERQLETWAHQGSVAQSAATYKAIKRVLSDGHSPYSQNRYEIFLQGSYANDTNVYAESDVDIVIRLDEVFSYDVSLLPAHELTEFDQTYAPAKYRLDEFRASVLSHLQRTFGGAVVPGRKAIRVPSGGGRREADVLVAEGFRSYRAFRAGIADSYEFGICFWASGQRIVNFPKQHSDNVSKKHHETSDWFKPTVRIYKNIRNAMVEDGVISKSEAPSYFLEGLLYNVPLDRFGGAYVDTVVQSFNWIATTSDSAFLCAHEQGALVGADTNLQWDRESVRRYLNAFEDYWNHR